METPESTNTVDIPLSMPEITSVSMRSPTMTASPEWQLSFLSPVRIISGLGLPQKYACVPVAISMGATSARQAGAIPFSMGPETSEFAPMSFAPLKTRFVAFVSVSSEYDRPSPTTT